MKHKVVNVILLKPTTEFWPNKGNLTRPSLLTTCACGYISEVNVSDEVTSDAYMEKHIQEKNEK